MASAGGDNSLPYSLIQLPADTTSSLIERLFGPISAWIFSRLVAARKRKLQVHMWTRPEAMSHVINPGLDNIITDHPAKLAADIRE